jgi:hypothetical protein
VVGGQPCLTLSLLLPVQRFAFASFLGDAVVAVLFAGLSTGGHHRVVVG